jgi:hypothetical protein
MPGTITVTVRRGNIAVAMDNTLTMTMAQKKSKRQKAKDRLERSSNEAEESFTHTVDNLTKRKAAQMTLQAQKSEYEAISDTLQRISQQSATSTDEQDRALRIDVADKIYKLPHTSPVLANFALPPSRVFTMGGITQTSSQLSFMERILRSTPPASPQTNDHAMFHNALYLLRDSKWAISPDMKVWVSLLPMVIHSVRIMSGKSTVDVMVNMEREAVQKIYRDVLPLACTHSDPRVTAAALLVSTTVHLSRKGHYEGFRVGLFLANIILLSEGMTPILENDAMESAFLAAVKLDISLWTVKKAPACVYAAGLLRQLSPSCDYCGKRSGAKEHPLKRCAQCKMAYYCGTRCRDACRDVHKQFCKDNKKLQ